MPKRKGTRRTAAARLVALGARRNKPVRAVKRQKKLEDADKVCDCDARSEAQRQDDYYAARQRQLSSASFPRHWADREERLREMVKKQWARFDELLKAAQSS